MPQMLTLSNGRPETIFSPKDFEDLIDKYMGSDCADYYREQVKALTEQLEKDYWFFDKYEAKCIEEVLKEYGYYQQIPR